MKNIITIQHTQSVHHTNGMIGAWTNWELTELGKQQAFNIGKALRKEITNKRYVMYASELLRAKFSGRKHYNSFTRRHIKHAILHMA